MIRLLPLLLAASAFAHGPDTDEDSWEDHVDCAPEDPEIYPGALEMCDELDNDCDGDVDEADECQGCGGGGGGAAAVLLVPLLGLGRGRGR